MPEGITGRKRLDVLTLGNRSIKLCGYDEDTQREYIQTLAHMYKHAKVGDPQFIEICQGRAEPMAKAGKLFSTCGEFAHFLLGRAGYRGPILNRDLFVDDNHYLVTWPPTEHVSQRWKQGKNIYLLFTKARKEGVFVEYQLSRDKGKRPNRGDIIYVSNGTPNSEHVFYWDGTDWSINGDTELWATIDGGQGSITTQHIAEGLKAFDQRTGRVYKWNPDKQRKEGAGRLVVGWVNVALLEFEAPAHLRMPA